MMKRSLVFLGSLLSLRTLSAHSLSPLPKLQATVSVESTLVSKERAVWEANRKRDARALSELLADDTYAVEADGRVLDKRQQLADLSTLSISDVTMANIRVLRLSAEVGVVRYRVRITRIYKGAVRTSPWNEATAVWARRDGRWQCVAYHATRAPGPSG